MQLFENVLQIFGVGADHKVRNLFKRIVFEDRHAHTRRQFIQPRLQLFFGVGNLFARLCVFSPFRDHATIAARQHDFGFASRRKAFDRHTAKAAGNLNPGVALLCKAVDHRLRDVGHGRSPQKDCAGGQGEKAGLVHRFDPLSRCPKPALVQASASTNRKNRDPTYWPRV